MIDAARHLKLHAMSDPPAISREPPKYRPILRAIGAYLDARHARHATIAEVEEGFIVHYFPQGDLTCPRHGTISHEALADFVTSITQIRIESARTDTPPQKRSPFRRPIPPEVRYSGGYEEVLRVFAQRFDRDSVRTILLTEGDYGWLLSCGLPVPAYVRADPRRMRLINYFHESVISHADLAAWGALVRAQRGTGPRPSDYVAPQ